MTPSLRWLPRMLCAGLLALATHGPASAQAVTPAGDTILLRGGSTMTGVQVVRKTPTGYKVQISESVVVDVPAGQVESITYDDYDPVLGRRRGETPFGAPKAPEIRAQEMASDLNKILTTPFAEEFSLPEDDLFAVLDTLSSQFGFAVEVHESLSSTAPEHRRWAVTIAQNTTLLRLFRDALPSRFPRLVALPQFDTVLVTTRADAEARGLIDKAAPAQGQDAPAQTQDTPDAAAAEPGASASIAAPAVPDATPAN